MKLNKKIIYSAIAITGITIATIAMLQNHKNMKHSSDMNHSDMNHTSGMEHSSHMENMNHSDMNHTSGMEHNTNSDEYSIAKNSHSVLTEAGTDPFAVIQEAIALLEANPDTDWSAVNIETLRLHLIEMQDMTLNVTVEQQPINFGFQAVITPTTSRALQSMSQVLSAHPAQMKEETGWDMMVTNNNGIFTIAVTTDQLQDVDKLRGLGYIGIMAYGSHHQPHHWAVALGGNPHSEHVMKH